MKYLLVIMFFNGQGEPQFVDGYLPLIFETYEECETRRTSAEEYIQTIQTPPYFLSCYEQVAPGDDA